MTRKTRGKGFPDFFGGREADDVRSQFIARPLAAAQEAAFTTAIGTLDFLAALPDALAMARMRELRRLTDAGREEDPRVRATEGLVAQAMHVKKVATLGQARAQRILTALNADRASFHGFVSSEDLAPLPRMTVRIVSRAEAGDHLEAATDDDGYFNIALDSRRKGSTAREREGGNTGERGGAGAADNDAKGVAIVEILDRSGRVAHRDPTELSLAPGRSAYREYFIEGTRTDDT
jgi:hypothetical protein